MFYVVYLLSDTRRRTYVGCTNNLKRRFRQHSRKLAAGAKYTKTFDQCRLEAYISQIPTKQQALSLEWHCKRREPAVNGSFSPARLSTFLGALTKPKFANQRFTIHMRQPVRVPELKQPILGLEEL